MNVLSGEQINEAAAAAAATEFMFSLHIDDTKGPDPAGFCKF